MNRPYVLSIAGHDPCGGAGLNADIKTFEQHHTMGLTICTALTIQDENNFLDVHWVEKSVLLQQLETVLAAYEIDVVKIGLISSFKILNDLLSFLHLRRPAIKVIWDPILKATSGFTFHNNFEELHKLLQRVYLLTPNRNEILLLTDSTDPEVAAKKLSKHCHILLKGGHAKDHATDFLFSDNNEPFVITGQQFSCTDKHGTGCVLSAAITSNLALGNSLEYSCTEGKHYVERFIQSTETRLGQHN